MILPAAFAKLAARGASSVAIVPVRKPRTVRRSGPRGTQRTGRSATYISRPWIPQSGHVEPLLSRTGRSTQKLAEVIIGEHEELTITDLLVDKRFPLVVRAGCKTRALFGDLWMRHYDRQWPILTEELCPTCGGHKIDPDGLECETCDPVGVILVEERQDAALVVERFAAHHGSTLVHVVHFELDHDDTRYLSPAAHPRGDELGYVTTTDLIDAGAAVPLSFQVDKISRGASERDDARRRRHIETGKLDDLDSGKLERSVRRARGRAA